jgi:hypothetical protein
VTATNADLYAKDLSPGTLAKSNGWDLVEAGWYPDWYPTGNKTMFLPVLDAATYRQTQAPSGSLTIRKPAPSMTKLWPRPP